jgi:hypothetical protein
MSAPSKRIMRESSYLPKDEGHTDDHGRVCGVCKEGYVFWFRYGVSPTELHVDSE